MLVHINLLKNFPFWQITLKKNSGSLRSPCFSMVYIIWEATKRMGPLGAKNYFAGERKKGCCVEKGPLGDHWLIMRRIYRASRRCFLIFYTQPCSKDIGTISKGSTWRRVGKGREEGEKRAIMNQSLARFRPSGELLSSAIFDIWTTE